jgi:hypothetical protein
MRAEDPDAVRVNSAHRSVQAKYTSCRPQSPSSARTEAWAEPMAGIPRKAASIAAASLQKWTQSRQQPAVGAGRRGDRWSMNFNGSGSPNSARIPRPIGRSPGPR